MDNYNFSLPKSSSQNSISTPSFYYSENPQSKTEVLLALSYYNSKEYDKCIEISDKIHTNYKAINILILKSYCLQYQGKTKEAILCFKTYLDAASTVNAWPLISWYTLPHAANEKVAAQRYVQDNQERLDSDESRTLLRGVLEFDQKNYRACLDILLQDELYKQNGSLALHCGESYLALGEYAPAKAMYQHYFSTLPSPTTPSNRAICNYALACFRLNHLDECLAILTTHPFRSSDSYSKKAFAIQFVALLRQRKLRDALVHWRAHKHFDLFVA